MGRSWLLLVGLALVALCFVPLASADTNFTLYQDAGCTQPIGEPAQLPFDSSTKCHPDQDQGVSFILYCAPDGQKTNFSLSVWNSTTDCSGDPTISLKSDAAKGTCAPTTITFQGQTVSAYATIQCSSSWPKEQGRLTVDQDEVQGTLEDVLEDVQGYVLDRASRKPSHPRSSNAIQRMLHGNM